MSLPPLTGGKSSRGVPGPLCGEFFIPSMLSSAKMCDVFTSFNLASIAHTRHCATGV